MKAKFITATCCISLAAIASAVEFLPVPNSQKGQVTFVNGQTRLPEAEIQAVCAIVENATKCKATIGSAEGAVVSIEIVDNPECPVMTAYPEDYKAIVNIAKLDKKLKGRALEKFFIPRCRKELLRAFCFACGAGGSQYPDNIMAIGDITDLDLVEEFIPGDTASTCGSRLLKVGITPTKFVSYARAVRDGWAPAPTNNVQQAIWDRVKAEQAQVPTKPMKIAPEMKPKGK